MQILPWGFLCQTCKFENLNVGYHEADAQTTLFKLSRWMLTSTCRKGIKLPLNVLLSTAPISQRIMIISKSTLKDMLSVIDVLSQDVENGKILNCCCAFLLFKLWNDIYFWWCITSRFVLEEELNLHKVERDYLCSKCSKRFHTRFQVVKHESRCGQKGLRHRCAEPGCNEW